MAYGHGDWLADSTGNNIRALIGPLQVAPALRPLAYITACSFIMTCQSNITIRNISAEHVKMPLFECHTNFKL